MKVAQPTANETQRLAALLALELLDTPAEERFDHITRFVQAYFSVPIALISLVDKNRQWFKSKQGLDVCETDRASSFCGHAIQNDEVFVVENALLDERFADNPLVVDGPRIRFYAGYPLTTGDGLHIGTLCIIDTEPRAFDQQARNHLRDFGFMVEAQIRQRSDELALNKTSPMGGIISRWANGYGVKDRRLVALGLVVTTLALMLGLAWLFEHPTETGLFGGAHYGLFALVGLLLSGIIYFLLCLPEHLRRHLQASHTAQIRSEMRFHDAIEALTDGFVIFDAQRRLVLYNDNFLKLYKPLTPAMKLGVTYEALREYARATGFIQTPAPGELDTPPPRVGTRDVQLADGRWHRIVERPMHDGGTVGFHSDITDLKNREQELRAATQLAETANRAKTQFLANVSHEVRTPLNAILGLMEVILEDQTLQSQQRFYMSTVQESADCLLKILNDILDASKMEAGMLNLKLAPFDLQATLLAVAQLMAKSAECKGLTLVTEFSPATQTWLVGDAGRIRQVLVNLISNAVKFTEAGSVTLRASCRPQTAQQVVLCVEVIDTGIGIKPEAIADLFKPFTQIESNCQKSHDGTGLGLSICAHLVELMDGEIELESEQGKGSHVRLLLPLRVQAPETEPQPLVSQEQNNQRPLRILLADDGEANQVVIRAMLSDTPHQLDTANDGSEALDAMGKADYDLILMDIYMPTMDGVTAAQRIRETHSTPIVAITANAMEGDRDRFIAAGMNAYLAKPLDKQQLLTTIARLTA